MLRDHPGLGLLAPEVFGRHRRSKTTSAWQPATPVEYFKQTGGVRKRKRFLADKKSTKRNVNKGKQTQGETVIKHNKDTNRFLLTDTLALAAVFLDGRLSMRASLTMKSANLGAAIQSLMKQIDHVCLL